MNQYDGFDIDIEKLKASNNPGAGKLPIPSALDEMVARVARRFVEIGPEERSKLSSLFTDQHSLTLVAFARRMASYAVRTGSSEKLLEGLAALVLDGGKFDSRENITVMAPLYDAALKIDANAQALFSQAADLLKNEVSEALRTFPSRSEESKSLACMHYVESEDADGFIYEKIW
jgi:hypothetical protein